MKFYRSCKSDTVHSIKCNDVKTNGLKWDNYIFQLEENNNLPMFEVHENDEEETLLQFDLHFNNLKS